MVRKRPVQSRCCCAVIWPASTWLQRKPVRAQLASADLPPLRPGVQPPPAQPSPSPLTLISAGVMRRLVGLCFTVAARESASTRSGLSEGSAAAKISSSFSAKSDTPHQISRAGPHQQCPAMASRLSCRVGSARKGGPGSLAATGEPGAPATLWRRSPGSSSEMDGAPTSSPQRHGLWRAGGSQGFPTAEGPS